MRILRFGLLLGAPLLVAAMDGNEIVRPMEGTLEIHTAELQFGPEEGRRTVHYQLEIDTRGRPKSCRVTRPSGDKAFDRASCSRASRAISTAISIPSRAGKLPRAHPRTANEPCMDNFSAFAI